MGHSNWPAIYMIFFGDAVGSLADGDPLRLYSAVPEAEVRGSCSLTRVVNFVVSLRGLLREQLAAAGRGVSHRAQEPLVCPSRSYQPRA